MWKWARRIIIIIHAPYGSWGNWIFESFGKDMRLCRRCNAIRITAWRGDFLFAESRVQSVPVPKPVCSASVLKPKAAQCSAVQCIALHCRSETGKNLTTQAKKKQTKKEIATRVDDGPTWSCGVKLRGYLLRSTGRSWLERGLAMDRCVIEGAAVAGSPLASLLSLAVLAVIPWLLALQPARGPVVVYRVRRTLDNGVWKVTYISGSLTKYRLCRPSSIIEWRSLILVGGSERENKNNNPLSFSSEGVVSQNLTGLIIILSFS